VLALRIIAGIAAGLWLAGAGLAALAALVGVSTRTEGAMAAGAVAVVAGVLLAAAVTTGTAPLPEIAAAVGVVALAVAVDRCWLVGWPAQAAPLAAATAVGLVAATRRLPRRYATGPVAGATVVAGIAAMATAATTAAGALAVAGSGLPVWAATATDVPHPFGWQLPACVLLGAAAVGIGPGGRVVSALGGRRTTVAVGAAVVGGLLALAVPAAFGGAWWVPALLDGAVAAPAAVVAATCRHRWASALLGAVAAVLAGHAVLTGLGSPEATAVVLGGLVALAAALVAVGSGERAGSPHGQVASAVGACALPGLGAAVARIVAGAGDTGIGWIGHLSSVQLGAVAGLAVATVAAAGLWRPAPGYGWAAASAAAVT
jgi:hypothetical protein